MRFVQTSLPLLQSLERGKKGENERERERISRDAAQSFSEQVGDIIFSINLAPIGSGLIHDAETRDEFSRVARIRTSRGLGRSVSSMARSLITVSPGWHNRISRSDDPLSSRG